MQIAVIAGRITQTEFQDKQLPEQAMIQFVRTILLQHLTAEDTRYSPAPLLQKEISDIVAAS